MDANAVIELFRRREGLLEGHFRLTAGLHGAGYVQWARGRRHPEEAVGAAAILDRGETPPGFDVPFEALLRRPLPVCEPESCPQCARGEPVTSPGSRPPPRPS